MELVIKFHLRTDETATPCGYFTKSKGCDAKAYSDDSTELDDWQLVP